MSDEARDMCRVQSSTMLRNPEEQSQVEGNAR